MKKLLIMLSFLISCQSFNIIGRVKIDLPAVVVQDKVGEGQVLHITVLNKEKVDLNVTDPLKAPVYIY